MFVAGCGFAPMYGSHTSSGAKLDSIYIDNIPDREGQYLRNALMDRFYHGGRPADPAYVLKIAALRERISDLDITKGSDATRSQLKLTTTMTLRDEKTDQVLLERDLISIASYNILDSQFTTRVSQEATRENALDDLARQIEAQLALYFDR
jgi:LPS-assembly lipoprotein